jgi:hypothetical protein
VGVSGIVIIIGSALFLCAAFATISFRVLSAKSATRKLEAIRASPTSWSVTQILFGLGGLVTPIGVGLFAYALRRQPSAWLFWASVVVLIPGTVLWLWHVYGRTVDPPTDRLRATTRRARTECADSCRDLTRVCGRCVRNQAVPATVPRGTPSR